MAIVLRSYLRSKNTFISCVSNNAVVSLIPCLRNFNDDKSDNSPYSSTTLLFEHGYNVQELPVVVRKLKDITELHEQPLAEPDNSQDPQNFPLIKEEFRQCIDLREVFSLLSKCTKITPSIALGAIERIYELEKDSNSITLGEKSVHINLAKGAILDKLLKVVVKTEDTQTILNILNTASTFMHPYKEKFSEEILMRVIDNKLSIQQMCQFLSFLITNKADPKYSNIIDKLWIGFVQKEKDINEKNIGNIFSVLHGLKASRKTILNLTEQKLFECWSKIDVGMMQKILETFIQEKYISMQSYAVVGRWLHTNIHAVDDDAMLDIVSKLTRLRYTDDQIEKAVEKYITLKGHKIKTHVLIVVILNFCFQFQIRNEHILNSCSEYIMKNGGNIPASFLKPMIYPFGFLNYNPLHPKFWSETELIITEAFGNITSYDLCDIVLSFIYTGRFPRNLISKLFNTEYLINVKNSEVMKKLNLIDTALSLESSNYSGPLLPKEKWVTPASQDKRIQNIIEKTIEHFIHVAGQKKVTTEVVIPHFCSHETYLIDVLLHTAELNNTSIDWMTKCDKNSTIAVLIHLPDHYCSDNKQLVGPQLMRKRHLKILGLQVVSLNYSMFSQLYTSHNTNGLREYLSESIKTTELSM